MAQLGTDVAILASGSVVLTALVVLIRAVFRVAFTIRDNTTATALLTGRLDSLAERLDHDFEKLAARVTALEKRRPRLDWACPRYPPPGTGAPSSPLEHTRPRPLPGPPTRDSGRGFPRP